MTTADRRIIYLCECGNPFEFDFQQIKPGASWYAFDSTNDKLPWSLPKNVAVKGLYCPWQKSDDISNLRCSVMIMEVIESGNFISKLDFVPSDNPVYRNPRPIAQAEFRDKKDGFVVSGLHNTSDYHPASKELTAILKYLPVQTIGNCVVGDMNIPYPEQKGKVKLNKYTVMAAGIRTQQSGNQLDWGAQNAKAGKVSTDIASKLCTIFTFDRPYFSGFNASDHEILVYSLTI